MVDILVNPEMVGYKSNGKGFYMPAWEKFIEGHINGKEFAEVAEEWEILYVSDAFSEANNLVNPLRRSRKQKAWERYFNGSLDAIGFAREASCKEHGLIDELYTWLL